MVTSCPHPRHPGQRADGGGAGQDQAPLQPLHAPADEPGCGWDTAARVVTGKSVTARVQVTWWAA